jgi:carboxypeptidase Q
VVLSAVAVIAIMASAIDAQSTPGWINAYRDTATRLIKAATADDFAWQRLAELTDTYGNRLSGSENLSRAIAWAAEAMKKDGLENVHTEKVMVPKWTRGRESAEIIAPASVDDPWTRRHGGDAAGRPR